jgi:predicted acetyltransferase
MADLTLRKANPSDVPELAQLHEWAYPLLDLSPQERQAVFADNPRGSLEDVYVVTDDRRPVACMIGYRFEQYQEEIAVPVVGIGNVAVRPDRRREGIAHFMITEALKELEEEGVAASILYPFQHRFYRRLGWGYAGEVREYRIPCSQLWEYDIEDEDRDITVELLTDKARPELMAFYEEAARQSNGLLKRGERYWRERILAPGKNAVVVRFSGDLIGYMIYSLQRCVESNSFVQEMVIHEWQAATLEAQEALLTYISRLNDQIQVVRLVLPGDESFHLWVEDPRSESRRMIQRLYAETAVLGLGWMFRIVNLQAAFESGRRFNGIQGLLTVELLDEQIGDRMLTFEFNGKNAKIRAEEANPKRRVAGSVDAFSQLFCGYTSAEDAFRYGLLDFEGEDAVEFCQNAFSLPKPRCFDLF